MNYSLNVKSSSIVHTLLSNCVKLLGKVQKLLIKCISYSVISKRIRVVSPKFYTARKNFTGPPVPTVPTNFKSANNIVYLKPTSDQKVWLIFSKKMFLGFVYKVGCIHPLGSLGHLLVRVVIKQFCWFFVKMFWGLS